jgi:hypothetical protein
MNVSGAGRIRSFDPSQQEAVGMGHGREHDDGEGQKPEQGENGGEVLVTVTVSCAQNGSPDF